MDINNNNNSLTDQINELYNSYKNSIKEQFELISEQQNKILLDLDEFYKKSLNLIINNKKNKNFKKNLSLNINNENNMIEKHIISKTPKNFYLNYNSNNNLYKSNSTIKTINFKSPSKQNNSIFNNNSTNNNKSKFYSNMNTIYKNDKNIKNKSNFYKKNFLIQDKNNNKKGIERSTSMLLKTNKDYLSKHNKNNSNFISNNKSKNNIINSKKNFNKSNNRKSFEKINNNNKNNNNNINDNNNNKVSNININDLKKFSIIDIPNEINSNLKKCFFLMSKNNIVPFNIRLKFIMNIKPIYNYYNINDISNDYINFLQNKISNLNQINKNLFFKPSKLAQINLNFLNKKNENDFYNNNIKNEDKKIVMLFIKIILNIEQINIDKFNDFKVTLLKLKEICKNNLKHFLLNSETIKKINNINENNLLKIFLFITNNNILEIEFNEINKISPVLNNIFFYLKELINFLNNKHKINESINIVNNELLKYKKLFENI